MWHRPITSSAEVFLGPPGSHKECLTCSMLQSGVRRASFVSSVYMAGHEIKRQGILEVSSTSFLDVVAESQLTFLRISSRALNITPKLVTIRAHLALSSESPTQAYIEDEGKIVEACILKATSDNGLQGRQLLSFLSSIYAYEVRQGTNNRWSAL